MIYEGEAQDQNLGWLSLVLAAGTGVYNYAMGAQKTNDAKFRAEVLTAAAAREKVAIDQLNAEAEMKRAVLIETVKKSMPVIGVILAASIIGGIMGRKKK